MFIKNPQNGVNRQEDTIVGREINNPKPESTKLAMPETKPQLEQPQKVKRKL